MLQKQQLKPLLAWPFFLGLLDKEKAKCLRLAIWEVSGCPDGQFSQKNFAQKLFFSQQTWG